MIACEFSGVLRRAFSVRGFEAWSCDLLPASDGSTRHIQGDAITAIRSRRWALVIAHPPCTRLCNSGVRWLHERGLWRDLVEGAAFFNRVREAASQSAGVWAIENPTPHGYARDLIGAPSFAVQPYHFGSPESKRTCFWVCGLPPLMPTTPHARPTKASCHKAPPTADRGALRSVTDPWIADAIATQWGRVIDGRGVT